MNLMNERWRISRLLIFKNSPIKGSFSYGVFSIICTIYLVFLAVIADDIPSFLKYILSNFFWVLLTFGYLKAYTKEGSFAQTMSSLFLITILMEVIKVVLIIVVLVCLLFMMQPASLLSDFMTLFLFSLDPSHISLTTLLSNKLLLVPVFCILIMSLWEFFVIAYIYTLALSVNRLIGVFIALQVFLINFLIFII